MTKQYTGQVGTEFILDTGILIGSATAQHIKALNPAGVESTWAASLYSSFSELAAATGTYLLKYSLLTNDVTVPGKWKFQAFIGTAVGTWYGETVELQFFDEFE